MALPLCRRAGKQGCAPRHDLRSGDVFRCVRDPGGLADRGGPRAERVLRPLGYSLDWTAFADAWRGEYQPGMEEVRSGRIPFSKLDVLHRRNLARFSPRFGLRDLSEDI